MGKSKRKLPDFIPGLENSHRATAEMAVAAVENEPALFEQLFQLCFEGEYPYNMRASRIIQLICGKHPEMINPYLDDLPYKLEHAAHDGVRRNFLKVINEFTGPYALSDPGYLAGLCFTWLATPSYAIAVRYHCLGILISICTREPELCGELDEILNIASLDAGKGLSNRISRARKEIRDIRKKFLRNQTC